MTPAIGLDFGQVCQRIRVSFSVVP